MKLIIPDNKKEYCCFGWKNCLEDDLRLKTILHIIAICLADTVLLVDAGYVALELQVMFAEVVGDGALNFGLQIQ